MAVFSEVLWEVGEYSVVLLVDAVVEGFEKNNYGIYNNKTSVVEVTSTTLPSAIITAINFDTALKRLYEESEEASKVLSLVPSDEKH